MNIDAARDRLSDLRAALIKFETELPADLALMPSAQAWGLYCLLRDIENQATELEVLEREDEQFWAAARGAWA